MPYWHITNPDGTESWLPVYPGAEREREEEAARNLQRTRMGILPYRRPQRGKVGYWWRRKWRFRALNPLAYQLRKMSGGWIWARP